MSEIRYVNPALVFLSKGWLSTCPGDAGSCSESDWVSLPAGLKLRVSEKKNGRFYFSILEGPLKGKTGTVREKLYETIPTLVESYTPQKETNLFVEFSKMPDSSRMLPGKLWAGETIEAAKKSDMITVVTDPKNPAPSGWHPLNIPDHPHALGLGYIKDSTWATTWFRLGDSDDRYLHCGRVSAGCVTVRPASQWGSLYLSLIFRRRAKDSKTVSAIFINI